MTDREFTMFAGALLRSIRKDTPKDTGNLRKNATRMEPVGAGKFRIRVKTEVAPYFKYVNGYETFIRKGKRTGITYGARNPNYGYFDRAVKNAVKTVAKKYGGCVEGV